MHTQKIKGQFFNVGGVCHRKGGQCDGSHQRHALAHPVPDKPPHAVKTAHGNEGFA